MNDFPKEINIGGIIWHVTEANIRQDRQNVFTESGEIISMYGGRQELNLRLISWGEKATIETKTIENAVKENDVIRRRFYFDEDEK
jgi:hypothetical protein